MISKMKAKEIAAEWYNGQWSGLYLIVCNDDMGRLTREQLERALEEVKEEREVQLQTGHKKDAKRLIDLELWIEYKIKERV